MTYSPPLVRRLILHSYYGGLASIVVLITVLAVLILPSVTHAAEGDGWKGLVPACGGTPTEAPGEGGSTVRTYTPCSTCDLAQLVKNLLDFVWKYVALTGVALMLMIGGFQMVTGALSGSAASHQKGLSTIKNAFIGLAIVFFAWLAIDTVIKFIAQQSLTGGGPAVLFEKGGAPVPDLDDSISSTETAYGFWNQLKCTKLNPVSVTTKPPPKVAPPKSIAQAFGAEYECPVGVTVKMVNGENVCDQAIKDDYEHNARNPEGRSLREPLGVGCIQGSMANYVQNINDGASVAGMDPRRFAALLQVESSGRVGIVSGRGAVGLGQVLPTTARDTLGILELKGKDNGQVTAWLMEPKNNIRASALYLQHLRGLSALRNDPRLIEAAYNAGPGPKAMGPSVHCNGIMRWQCPYDSFNAENKSCYPAGTGGCRPNTGFAQTRAYSEKIDRMQADITNGACKATVPSPPTPR